MKFSEVLGVTKLKPFSLGNMKENLPPKIHRVFHAGEGGKNAKFHHLNVLGAALRKYQYKGPPENVIRKNCLNTCTNDCVGFLFQEHHQ